MTQFTVIQLTVAVVIIMVRITAEESKSGSSGDVDVGDKGGMSPSQRTEEKKKVFGSVSPLDQHGNVFNHKPKCLFHITPNISTLNTRIKEMQEGNKFITKSILQFVLNTVFRSPFLHHTICTGTSPLFIS